MRAYEIIVSVVAKDQGAAFRFVEEAIERKIEREVAARVAGALEDGSVSVKTPDGVKSVVF